MDRTDRRWRSWQDIGFPTNIQARYLRFIGTYRSDTKGFVEVVEWEVYGKPPVEIVTSNNTVTVPERSTAKFWVKLNQAPTHSTTVTVSRVDGDTNITVLSSTSLVFSTSNWNTNRPVTLGAAADADWTNSRRLFGVARRI